MLYTAIASSRACAVRLNPQSMPPRLAVISKKELTPMNNPPKERIASSFKQLSVVSTDLNLAADEFSKTISTLDEALKSLKLGVSAWHKVASHEVEQYGNFWTRDIGYAQVQGKWGTALRTTW